MLGMDGAISGKGLDPTAQAHAKAHRVSRVAHTDFLFQPRLEIHERNRAVEHHIHTFAKAGFLKAVHCIFLSVRLACLGLFDPKPMTMWLRRPAFSTPADAVSLKEERAPGPQHLIHKSSVFRLSARL